MTDIYFKAFEKYGAALAAVLHPSQLETLRKALEQYEATGKAPEIQDSFTKLAAMMIICDIRYEREKNAKRD